MKEIKRIQEIVKSLQEDRDSLSLPDEELLSLSLEDNIQTLKMAMFLIHLYKDR